MLRTLPVLLFAVILALPAALSAGENGLPAPGTLDGLGVNVHFTHAKPGELEQLAAGGFRWVRMDFQWGGIERERSTYDFSAYDRLLADLDRLRLRGYFILDYGNRLYDGDQSPHTDEGRAAFCAFVAAAMKHFQGRGVVWEMWNEPNIGFWKPVPNVDDYAKLALAVGKTIRAVAPKELFVGPATSEVDLRFEEACYKAGCLEFWDAVSVHPYRHRAPETAGDDYRTMRRLIARYAPKDDKGTPKMIPILSGEWGYSSGGWGEGYDEVRQGRYLPRQWLTNLSNDVPISVWYDWHEDGEAPKEGEHHFGTVRFPYRQGQAEVYEPKPAYLAAKTLTTQLAGLRFSKRLAVSDPDDQVLLFAQGDQLRVVAWTLGQTAHQTLIPASAGMFHAVDHLGSAREKLTADAQGLAVTLNDAPLYLTPERANDLLRLAAAWERLALDQVVHAPDFPTIGLTLTNPLERPLVVATTPGANRPVMIAPRERIRLEMHLPSPERRELPQPLQVSWSFAGLGLLRQDTRVIVTNPLFGNLLPVIHREDTWLLPIRIANPSGEAFSGWIALTGIDGLQPAAGRLALTIAAGSTETILRFPLKTQVPAGYRCGVVITAADEKPALTIAARSYHPIDDFAEHGMSSLHTAYQLHADGDSKVASEQTYGLGPADAVAPIGGPLAITYRFDKGWKFLRLAPFAPKDLPGNPTAIGMWVKSDDSGNIIRLRVTDSTGQTFQPDAGKLTWSGWQWCEFDLASATGGHWGGANDGKPHAPLKLDTLFLLDQANPAQPSAGSVQIAGPMVIE